jgi:hypothetical protein
VIGLLSPEEPISEDRQKATQRQTLTQNQPDPRPVEEWVKRKRDPNAEQRQSIVNVGTLQNSCANAHQSEPRAQAM